MKCRRSLLFFLPGSMLLLAGCAADTPSISYRVDPVIADQVLTSAAEQVRRCYRAPRVASVGKQIITRLEIRLNADGTLAELPAVVGQTGLTPENQPYASRMAEAASLAVIRCAPLRLPPEHYVRIWHSFELKFSPRKSV
jgi:hypothetical protein